MSATWNPNTVNDPLPPLAITTSEDTISIKYSQPLSVPGATPPGRPEPMIQLRSDQDWYYYTAAASSNVYPVKANEVFNLRVPNAFGGVTVYVKAISAPGTIWAMRVQ